MTTMKPSAAMTLWGILASVVGSAIWVNSSMAAMTAGIFEDTDSYAAGQFIGFLISVLGLILTLVGTYRALAKIDAIPVPVPVLPVPFPQAPVNGQFLPPMPSQAPMQQTPGHSAPVHPPMPPAPNDR
jgi:hypothetical protein